MSLVCGALLGLGKQQYAPKGNRRRIALREQSCALHEHKRAKPYIEGLFFFALLWSPKGWKGQEQYAPKKAPFVLSGEGSSFWLSYAQKGQKLRILLSSSSLYADLFSYAEKKAPRGVSGALLRLGKAKSSMRLQKPRNA